MSLLEKFERAVRHGWQPVGQSGEDTLLFRIGVNGNHNMIWLLANGQMHGRLTNQKEIEKDLIF